MKVIKSNQIQHFTPKGASQKPERLGTIVSSTGRIINYETRCTAERYVCACVSDK